MTDPSQYFKGRTVQEQMNEVIGYVDTRAAEVATTAIASDVAQVHQDMLDADADATAAAASAAAAAGTLANAVKKTGEASQSIAGNIEISGTLKSQGTLYAVGDASVGGNLGVGGSTNVGDLTATGVVAVPTPTGNTHAANKKYVDDKDALDVHLAGNEAITGNKTVPLEATGTFSDQIASSNKVKNELDNYAPMVRTTGNQTIAGVKTFMAAATGLMTYGTADTSTSLNIGDYKAIYRIARSGLSTFRGVCSIAVWQRAVGDSFEILNVAFHGNTAVGIFRFGFNAKTCEYFVSADSDYVYIGIKALSTSLTSVSKQMFVIGAVGFNQTAVFESYIGTPGATPEGTLIAETS